MQFVTVNIFALNCFQACDGSAGQHVTTLRLTEADFRLFPDDHTARRGEEGRFKIPDLVAVQLRKEKVDLNL